MTHPVIVFDLDGTLIDTAPDLIATLNVILTKEGMPPVPYEQARTLIGGGAKVMLARGLAAEGRDASPAQLDKLFVDFVNHYSAHIADHSRPFPGLEQTLDQLSGDGFKLAVCTNKLEGLSRKLLDALKLTPRFAFICGQDTFAAPKPNPDTLRKTIAAASGSMSDAFMIGDSETDVLTARAAGVPIVAVDFGYTPRPIAEFRPDRVISRFSELPTAIAAIRRNA
ncbi:MAG TPA: phosphoglycolate phosphatase [Pseudolabrys sp.]|nr:phosphoglycolate phosphatase [Pseudolabrys sp.]